MIKTTIAQNPFEKTGVFYEVVTNRPITHHYHPPLASWLWLTSYFSAMPLPNEPSTPLFNIEADTALRAILEGTATETGERFFSALVQNLAKALGTHGAWVTEYFPEHRRLRALAFWMDGQWVTDYEVDIAGFI